MPLFEVAIPICGELVLTVDVPNADHAIHQVFKDFDQTNLDKVHIQRTYQDLRRDVTITEVGNKENFWRVEGLDTII